MNTFEDLRERYAHGRTQMIEAFVAMARLADPPALGTPPPTGGALYDETTRLMGLFLDGATACRHAFGTAVMLAEIFTPRRGSE